MSTLINAVVSFVSAVSEDFSNFDWDNTDEQKALNSNYFSAYKGTLVIRIGGERSGSLGAIFLTRKNMDSDVVRHEYGHTKQLERLGLFKYLFYIGLPSWQNFSTGDYYDKPWEVTADIFGDVQSRNHSSYNIKRGVKYLKEAQDGKPPFKYWED